MKLLEAEETGKLFTVRIVVNPDFFGKLFGAKKRIDVIIFNKRTGTHIQSGLIARGSFDIAMHEYFKRYGTYGKV